MSGYNSKPLPPARAISTPEGWLPSEQFDPFEAFLGPYFERKRDGAREFSFLADDRHSNAQGAVHDGALLTFADAALGYTLWDATERAPCVTVSQHSEFIAAAQAGDLVTCLPALVHKTSDVVFIRGDFLVGTKIIFTVSAIWRIWPKA